MYFVPILIVLIVFML